MFIMGKLGQVEQVSNMDEGALTTFNKMQAGFQVKVELGIGGLKRKFQHLMKRFDVTKRSTTIYS